MIDTKDGAVADEPELAADVPADPSDDVDTDAVVSEEVELSEAEQVAQVAAQSRPVRKSATSEEAAAGKGHATPKQRKSNKAASEEHHRTTPAQFVRESIAELKKVVWPTGNQLQQYFIVVLVFVLIMIGIVSVLDLAFGAGILKIFG